MKPFKLIRIAGLSCAILCLTACSILPSEKSSSPKTTEELRAEQQAEAAKPECDAPPLSGISDIGEDVKAAPSYVRAPRRGDSSEQVFQIYTAEAVRINQWINIGHGGLIRQVEDKESEWRDYEQFIQDYFFNCRAARNAASDQAKKEITPKREWWRFGR